eukprot:gnl/Chilomastix_cuspidata/132.p1 GENE.gnl/Chilomastix_cuspidata/132~~gnl/Chilomastix_cuspidata/132.p1  ORF type:complete len:524 (+),score=185.99 gnl/Chilomastix_cuspidata/132:162-1574(+)
MAYLQSFVYPSAAEGSLILRNVNIVSGVLTFFLCPWLGAIADKFYIRLWIVLFSTIIYAGCTLAFYAVREDDYKLATVLYFFSTFAFRFNETVSSAFLPSLCNDRDIGFVSGFGFFVGFISGTVVLLIVNLVCETNYNSSGQLVLENVYLNRATSMLIVGIIMVLSALPPLLMLDNGRLEGEKRPKFTAREIGLAFKQNFETIKSGFTINIKVTLLLLNYFCFALSCYFATSYLSVLVSVNFLYTREFTVSEYTNAVIIYNIVTGAASVMYGLIAKKIGSKPLIIFSFFAILLTDINGILFGKIVDWLGVERGRWYLWFSFPLSGLGIGPVQALLRGLVGIFTPPEQKNEVFGVMESFQLLAVLLGGTIPSLYVQKSIEVYYIIPTIFSALGLVMACVLPIRKAEKEARKRFAALEGKTIDEVRAQELAGAIVTAGTPSHPSEETSSSSSSTTSVPLSVSGGAGRDRSAE